MIRLASILKEVLNESEIPSFQEFWNDIKDSPDVIDGGESEKIHRQYKYDQIKSQYSSLHNKPCYRSIAINRGDDATKLKKIGPSWSILESAALDFEQNIDYNTSQELVLFTGKIDKNNIDWMTTLYTRTHPIFGDDEQEVRFLKNKQIYIYSVRYLDRKDEVWHIKDFRMT